MACRAAAAVQVTVQVNAAVVSMKVKGMRVCLHGPLFPPLHLP